MNGGARSLAPFTKSLSKQRIRAQPSIGISRPWAFKTNGRYVTTVPARTPAFSHNTIQPNSNLVMAAQASSRKNVHLVVLIHGLWGESSLTRHSYDAHSGLQVTPSTSTSREKSWQKHTRKQKPVPSSLAAVIRNYGSSSRRATKVPTRTMGSMSVLGE